jgi:hypothetical protein
MTEQRGCCAHLSVDDEDAALMSVMLMTTTTMKRGEGSDSDREILG